MFWLARLGRHRMKEAAATGFERVTLRAVKPREKIETKKRFCFAFAITSAFLLQSYLIEKNDLIVSSL